MEENGEYEIYNKLKCNYIFHIITFIVIFCSHILIYCLLYWIKTIMGLLFLCFSFIQIIYIIIPTILLIILSIKKEIINKYSKTFIIINKIFIFISIIIGIVFSILVIIHTVIGKVFRNECPFNVEDKFISSFNETFNDGNNVDEIKDKCQERICLLYDYNEYDKYPYKYLCNYNPEKDFEEKLGNPYSRTLSNGTELKTYNQIECNLLGPLYSNSFDYDNIIYQYLSICYYLTDFYYCGRFEEPKKYDISNLDECPGDNYIFILGILCVYIIIVDIFISFIPWVIENKSYNILIEKIEDYTDINKNKNNKEDKKSNQVKKEDKKSKENKTNNKKIKKDKKKDNKSYNDKNNDKCDNSEDKKDDNEENNNQENKKISLITKYQSINTEGEINFVKPSTKIIIKDSNILINNEIIEEQQDEINLKENNENKDKGEKNKSNENYDISYINNNDNNPIIFKKRKNNNDYKEEKESNKNSNKVENNDSKSNKINENSEDNKDIIINQDKNIMKNFIKN